MIEWCPKLLYLPFKNIFLFKLLLWYNATESDLILHSLFTFCVKVCPLFSFSINMFGVQWVHCTPLVWNFGSSKCNNSYKNINKMLMKKKKCNMCKLHHHSQLQYWTSPSKMFFTRRFFTLSYWITSKDRNCLLDCDQLCFAIGLCFSEHHAASFQDLFYNLKICMTIFKLIERKIPGFAQKNNMSCTYA